MYLCSLCVTLVQLFASSDVFLMSQEGGGNVALSRPSNSVFSSPAAVGGVSTAYSAAAAGVSASAYSAAGGSPAVYPGPPPPHPHQLSQADLYTAVASSIMYTAAAAAEQHFNASSLLHSPRGGVAPSAIMTTGSSSFAAASGGGGGGSCHIASARALGYGPAGVNTALSTCHTKGISIIISIIIIIIIIIIITVKSLLIFSNIGQITYSLEKPLLDPCVNCF